MVTQKLRTILEDIECGIATTGEAHNELLNIERALGLPLTTAEESNA